MFWLKMSKFGYLGSKFEKWKQVENSRFKNFETSLWIVSCFWVVSAGFALFWLVLAHFGWFRLVSGFNNYVSFYSVSDSLTNCCRLTFHWYTKFFSLELICNIVSRSNVRLCLIKNLYHINCLVRSWL